MKRIKLEDLASLVEQGWLHADQHCYRCQKIAYDSQQQAADSARRQRGHLERNTSLRPYPCPHGHGWHLTSMKQLEHPMHRRRRLRREKRAKGKRDVF